MANRNTKALRTKSARHGKFVRQGLNDFVAGNLEHGRRRIAAHKKRLAEMNADALAKWNAAVAAKKLKDKMILVEENHDPVFPNPALLVVEEPLSTFDSGFSGDDE